MSDPTPTMNRVEAFVRQWEARIGYGSQATDRITSVEVTGFGGPADLNCSDLRALITSARSVGGDVVELREALEPFAEAANKCPENWPDGTTPGVVNLGQCRAARAALSRIESGGGALPAQGPSVPTEQADRAVVASRTTVKTGDEVWVRGEASDVCTSCVFVRVPTIHDKPMGSYLHWRNVRVAAVSPGEQAGIGPLADEHKDIPHPAKSDSSTGGES